MFRWRSCATSNPILARGLERFADALVAERGQAGLIVPDLPLEEAPAVASACEERGLALVPLVAPTTPEERLERIGAGARGLRLRGLADGHDRASARGSTARSPAVVARTRAATRVPVAVGFGISTPEHASAAARAGADGVIIGTRLVRAAADAADPASAAGELVREFSLALR